MPTTTSDLTTLKHLQHTLCHLDGACPDPCMHDVLTAVVAIANGEPARPWWAFTPARKARTTPITPHP